MSQLENDSARRRTILEALGSYQRITAASMSADEMADIVADESDRGVVVILVSLIEDLLLHRLQEAFVPMSRAQLKNLTRAGGLLSNFDDRINLAHALDIIDEDTVEMLQVMRTMRNACAHSRKRITFDTQELRDALTLLIEDQAAPEHFQKTENSTVLRLGFICAWTFVTTRICGKDHDAAQEAAQETLNTAFAVISEAARQQSSHGKPTIQSASRPHPDTTG